MADNYDDYSKEELIKSLRERDRKPRFGLYWERDEIELERAINDDFVALDLDESLSCGDAPYSNLIIEGDNFDALRYLRMTYKGAVKCIYIDPPYNTGNKDFVYNDRFIDKDDVYKHSKWLEFMYRRLELARDLLAEDGVIFVSIDDNEVFNLGLLMNQVFGGNNFVANIIWQRSKKGDAKLIASIHEYIVVYAKNKNQIVDSGKIWRKKKEGVDEVLTFYAQLKKQHNNNHEVISKEIAKWFNSLDKNDSRKSHKHYRYSDDRGLYFAADFAGPNDGRDSRPRYDIFHPVTGNSCKKPSTGWRWEEKRTKEALEANPSLIHFGVDETTIPCRKSYLEKVDEEPFTSVFYKDGRAASLQVDNLLWKNAFNFPKNVDVIEDLIRLTTNNNSIVLDFFAGSGTTAHAVLNLNKQDNGNRRFILISNTEATDSQPDKNLCRDVCAERVRRVMQGYTNQKAEQVEGLGGNFAYLKTRRIAAEILLTEIQHSQIWTALQLSHGAALSAFNPHSSVQQLQTDNDVVMYLCTLTEQELTAVTDCLQALQTVVVYCWQPALLMQHIADENLTCLPIPQILIDRFATGVKA